MMGLLLLLGAAGPWGALQAGPQLSASAAWAQPGGRLSLTVTGSPGAAVKILASGQPAEVNLGAAGLQFYKSGTQVAVASGVVPPSGVYTTSIAIPTSAALGASTYLQAQTVLDGQPTLSNGLAYRVQNTPPSGARKTTAMVVTPDGTRAYVADVLDGVVTMLDAVNDTRLAELPITTSAQNVPHRPIRLAMDPEGRHAFVSNAAATSLTVIHAPTGSVSAQIPVPRGCRGVGFDFRNGVRRIYVANETQNAVLVFLEAPLGTFKAAGSIPLQTTAPGPLLVLPDGKLAVGSRAEGAVEFLNPQGTAGATTLSITPISGSPYELVWSGQDMLVPTFTVVGQDRVPGYNRVLRLDPVNFQVTGSLFDNLGTDYASMAARPSTAGGQALVAVSASGTGTLIVGDSVSQTVLAHIELTEGYPDATPHDVVIVNNPSTRLPAKIYAVDYFRETVRPILLAGGPPYVKAAEIPLAWSGQVRVPLSSALSKADNGEWLFRNVGTFGGTAFAPNPVTCNTCHRDGASDNSRLHDFQVPAAWRTFPTAPYFWDGSVPTIDNLVLGALSLHNHTGKPPPPGAKAALLSFLSELQPPSSIYRLPDGSMTADQLAGKAIFEGPARCLQCHAGTSFIPPAGSPLTITEGVGTGLAPANVPSLVGAWATAPYLNQGQARTLMEVFKINPADVHGQFTAGLTETELQQLVAYLKAL